MTPIKDWPLSDQPRRRMLERGPQELTDSELLCLILGASSRGAGGVLETCRQLLLRFGGLEALGRCRPGELMEIPGIGEARACAVASVIELARRLESSRLTRGAPITCSADVYRHVKGHLSMLDQEIFLTLALDARFRILRVNQVARGSLTSVEVHPREVFAPVLRETATAIIVAHNHPSGDVEPSNEDKQLTTRLKQAGEILGVPLLDHIIVGAGCFVSLADRGLL